MCIVSTLESGTGNHNFQASTTHCGGKTHVLISVLQGRKPCGVLIVSISPSTAQSFGAAQVRLKREFRDALGNLQFLIMDLELSSFCPSVIKKSCFATLLSPHGFTKK